MKKVVGKGLFKLAKTRVGDLIVGLAFGKFSDALPVNRVKETDKVIAFWHPSPSYETHILIVPKKAIKSFANITSEDSEYLNEIFMVAKELVQEFGLEDYSLITNGGEKQEVNQLHFHLVSGNKIAK